MIHITLKDGVVKDFEAPVTPMQIAKSIGEGLYKAVCVAKIDGVVRDLRTPIEQDAWLCGQHWQFHGQPPPPGSVARRFQGERGQPPRLYPHEIKEAIWRL